MNRRQQVIDHLLGRITAGKLREGQKIPSEQELAQRIHVNKTTANKAVACLVERGILERRHGAGGTIVRQVPAHPGGTIAFLLDLNISYQVHLLCAAQQAAFARGYALQFLQRNNLDGGSAFWDRLKRSDLRGLLLCSHAIEPPAMACPVMYVDAIPYNVPGGNWILTDDFAGGYLIGSHLMKAGHRNVVFISVSPPLETNLRRRVDGFAKALRENGIDQVEKRLIAIAKGQLSLIPLLDMAFQEFPGLTAMAFDRDNSAAQAIGYCMRRGLRVPQDLSVSGYGMVEENHLLMPITSIEQHPFQLSFHATNRLLDLVEGRRTAPIQETFPVEFVQGSSTRELRERGRKKRG